MLRTKLHGKNSDKTRNRETQRQDRLSCLRPCTYTTGLPLIVIGTYCIRQEFDDRDCVLCQFRYKLTEAAGLTKAVSIGWLCLYTYSDGGQYNECL